MKMAMYLKSVAVVLFAIFLGQGFSHISDRNVTLTDCQTICASSGGLPDFNNETKVCKCLPAKNIDDIDLALINKNANLIGKAINNIQAFNKESVVIKRDVAFVTESQASPPTQPSVTEQFLGEPISEEGVLTITTPLNNEDDETDLNPEGIVGQALPPRRQQRPIAPRRQQPRPISLEQQRIILQQIHDHLNRLGQITDHRLREIEIEAIRTNLRQLSHTVVNQPQIRARIRNGVTDNRRRPQRPRGLHSRLVSAAAPQNSTDVEEVEVDTAIKEIFHGKKRHHEIITQDPRLIDE